MKKTFSFLVSVLVIMVLSCTKIDTNQRPVENSFILEAKSWFNSQFKNTGEYKLATANGQKTPKWKRGIVYKIGNIQFAEFPLITSRKKVYITESLSDADKLRVAEDTKLKALFIKVPGKPIEVRIVQFTPSFNYLKSKNFNLSTLSFQDYTKDFKGNFMMFDFANNLIVGYQYTNDAVKTLKFNPKSVGNNGEALSTEDGCDDVDPNCTYQMTTTYEIICDAGYNIDEGFNPNYCTMRVLDFSCVLIRCDTDDDLQNCINEGNTMENCLCNLYGICDGGGGGDDPPEEPIAASFNFVNVFAVKQSGSTGTNEDWTIEQRVTINGMKFPDDPARNYYTTFVESSNCYYHNNNPAYGGIYGNTNSLVYCTVLGGNCTTNSSLIENNKKFTNTSSAFVHYPNYRNQQGQPAPFSNPYSNTKISIAENDL